MTRALPKTLDVLPNVPLGPEYVTKRGALLGQSESGKTNGVAVIGEELFPLGAPVFAIDTLGNLYGWRSSADGERDGLPIAIFGGEHADVPISAGAGAALARELVAARASAIIDVSELDDEEARGFIADFLNDLYRYNRRPVHLLVDEAHEWAPEQPVSKEHFRCRSALRRVRKLGRNRGIGSTLASQSSADLDKKALGQTDVLFALRTSAPTDVRPILAWAKGHLTSSELATIQKTLGSLSVGEAWVISPGYLRITKRSRFRLRHTYDSSRTPTLGDEVREPNVFAPVDLERIAKAIEADATGEVKPVVVPRAIAAREVEVPVLSRATLDELGALLDGYAIAAQQVATTAAELVHVGVRATALLETVAAAIARVDGKRLALPRVAGAAPAIAPAADETTPPARRPRSAAVAAPSVAQDARDGAGRAETPRAGVRAPVARGDGPTLKAGMRRMLVAIRRAGRPLTRVELGAIANVQRGGTMTDYLRSLGANGYAQERDGLVALTAAGAAVVADVAPVPPATSELLDLHRPYLKAGQVRILMLLVDLYPKHASRRVLAAQANVQRGGTMTDYLRALLRRGLIEQTATGARAADVLFLNQSTEGRIA